MLQNQCQYFQDPKSSVDSARRLIGLDLLKIVQKEDSYEQTGN
jgi:hypothetical protein